MKLIDVLFSNPVKGALLFAMIAPPLGTFAFCALVALPFLWISIRNQDPAIALGSLLVIFTVPVFSWIFGAIPAIFTGLIVGMRRPMLSTWYGPLVSGVVGLLVTTFTFGVILQPPGAISVLASLESKWDSLSMLGVCAFLGGAGAGRLFRLRPNKSFKPTPGVDAIS